MTRSSERLCLIANPHSAGGRTARRLDEIRRAAATAFEAWELRVTEGPGHATELARDAAREGFSVVASVGGDGTAHETVNGLFEDGVPVAPDVVFTVVPAGTGSDLVKTLGMPASSEAALAIAAGGDTRHCDVLDLHFHDEEGAPARRMCINVAGFGVQGEVVRLANQSSKRLGGTLTFLKATVQGVLSYTPGPVRVTWEGEGDETGEWEGNLSSCFLANAAYCGGGMWLGPQVSMHDGRLDVVLIPDLPILRQVVALPRLFNGTAEKVDGVVRQQVRRLSAEAIDGRAVRIDVDGEQPGVLPLRAEMRPKVLRVRGQWTD